MIEVSRLVRESLTGTEVVPQWDAIPTTGNKTGQRVRRTFNIGYYDSNSLF